MFVQHLAQGGAISRCCYTKDTECENCQFSTPCSRLLYASPGTWLEETEIYKKTSEDCVSLRSVFSEEWVCPYNDACQPSRNSVSSAAGARSLRNLFHSSFFALIPVLHTKPNNLNFCSNKKTQTSNAKWFPAAQKSQMHFPVVWSIPTVAALQTRFPGVWISHFIVCMNSSIFLPIHLFSGRSVPLIFNHSEDCCSLSTHQTSPWCSPVCTKFFCDKWIGAGIPDVDILGTYRLT